jgi:enoyl-[acyl-carrier-protein] reductase (NADH)
MTVEGKVIVLTGAASGMGRATALLLASKGARLSLADVQEGPLSEVAKEIEKAGGTAMTTVVDVRDRKAVESWIDNTVSKLGKLDGAANLAGVIGKQNNLAPIQDIDDDDWDFGKISRSDQGRNNQLIRDSCRSQFERHAQLHACSDTSHERRKFHGEHSQRVR